MQQWELKEILASWGGYYRLDSESVFFLFFSLFFCCKINYFELKERYRPPEDKLIVRSDFRLISVNIGKEAKKGFRSSWQHVLCGCSHHGDEFVLRETELEPRTDIWNQEVSSKAILFPGLS